MAMSVIAKGFGGAGLLAAAELFLSPSIGLDATTTLALPTTYGLVIGINAVASSFVLITLGMKVGAARKKFDVQYPTMYAPGKEGNDKTFNCIQRAHQQALETYAPFLVLSLIGGIRHPLTTAAAGAIWCYARIKWAEGYSTGDPDKRYSDFFSRFIWYSLLAVKTTALSTALHIGGLI